MILNPGVISLVIGSAAMSLMMFYASMLALKILEAWDINSSSAEQLSLERKTYLVSTIVNYVLGFVILSAFLFVYNVDDIHRQFIGAMCATGSLNANPVGWIVLYTKIIVIFLSLIWIALNYLDRQAEDYPLVRKKYSMLVFITAFIVVDSYLQLKYFMGLKPNIIVSCCGSLFNEGEGGIASSLSSLPAKPLMITFYMTAGVFLVNAILSLWLQKSIFKYMLAILSFAFFVVSIASIISFISLYFYEIPTHHCPFDIIQKDYDFIGYPLYITLFGGAFFGMATGIAEQYKKIASLQAIINKAQRKWIILSILMILTFIAISSWPVIFSSFTLEGYY
jgi:hypothetical protein